ncbi:MAG: hypothetical protein O2931_03140 [Planctomycetota bacterium]|nr:hypothetical protein [Planctomycetota bacterium]MDA1177773.1 hypothetical protein [Planctomycetota bacterium]
MFCFRYKLLVLATAGCFCPSSAWCQVSWTNPATGVGAGDWFAPTNWNVGIVPTTLDNALINNGGEARATVATSPSGGVGVNRLEVGRNNGTGTFTSTGVSVAVDSDFDVGEIGGTFALGPITVSSNGRMTIRDAASLTIGLVGDGDLDVGQGGASLGATAHSRGVATIERVGAVTVAGDIDIGQLSADATSTTSAAATLTVNTVNSLSISGDLDVGPVGGVGNSSSQAIANITGVTSLVIGGGIDVGTASGSTGGTNAANGKLTITDSTVALGLGDPLLPRGVNIGNASAGAGQRSHAIGEVNLTRVALDSAGSIDIGSLTGSLGNASNSSNGLFTADRSSITAASVRIATIDPGVVGSAAATMTLRSTFADISDTFNLGDGAILRMELGGLVRAASAPAGGVYSAIDAETALLDGDLVVSLAGGFQPQVGHRFELIQANLFGAFDSLVLPQLAAGLDWFIDSSATRLAIQVVPAGDYNANGLVDAADFSIWRDSLGSTTQLAADGNRNGVVDQNDYTIWQTNFGMSGSGGATALSLPEPSGTFLLSFLLCGIFPRPTKGRLQYSVHNSGQVGDSRSCLTSKGKRFKMPVP